MSTYYMPVMVIGYAINDENPNPLISRFPRGLSSRGVGSQSCAWTSVRLRRMAPCIFWFTKENQSRLPPNMSLWHMVLSWKHLRISSGRKGSPPTPLSIWKWDTDFPRERCSSFTRKRWIFLHPRRGVDTEMNLKDKPTRIAFVFH